MFFVEDEDDFPDPDRFLDFDGTVWIVPQYWHRQTPPAKASSISSNWRQWVQWIEIMG